MRAFNGRYRYWVYLVVAVACVVLSVFVPWGVWRFNLGMMAILLGFTAGVQIEREQVELRKRIEEILPK